MNTCFQLPFFVAAVSTALGVGSPLHELCDAVVEMRRLVHNGSFLRGLAGYDVLSVSVLTPICAHQCCPGESRTMCVGPGQEVACEPCPSLCTHGSCQGLCHSPPWPGFHWGKGLLSALAVTVGPCRNTSPDMPTQAALSLGPQVATEGV